MKDLKEIKKELEEYNVFDYDKEDSEIYNDLYNLVADYSIGDYLLSDYITYDEAEELAKNELNNGGLVRLYYFLGNANFNRDLFKIDGYGNLQDVYRPDLEDLKAELIDEIDNEIEDVEE